MTRKTKKMLTSLALMEGIDAGMRLLEEWPREVRAGMWECRYCKETGATADDIKHAEFDPETMTPDDYDPDCPVVAMEKAIKAMKQAADWHR